MKINKCEKKNLALNLVKNKSRGLERVYMSSIVNEATKTIFVFLFISFNFFDTKKTKKVKPTKKTKTS